MVCGTEIERRPQPDTTCHSITSFHHIHLCNYHYHTHIQIRQKLLYTLTVNRKCQKLLSPFIEFDPIFIGLLQRCKLIFCYYFSCVWCKTAHYISRTALFVSSKLVGEINYTINTHSLLICSIQNGSNKAKITFSRDVLISVGYGHKFGDIDCACDIAEFCWKE